MQIGVLTRKQILLDALTHGFVTIDKIGLLIYDEGWYSYVPDICEKAPDNCQPTTVSETTQPTVS